MRAGNGTVMVGDGTDTANEVTWQVAWWALVPLATGAMTQPCGRVLDQDIKNFRFYARASPFVCVGDMVLFGAMLLLGMVNEPPSRWLSNAKYEIRRRFQDEPAADPDAAKSTLLGRWALMILGGIPCQTIKLVAMSGIPWTKTWAFMYFISLILGEALILLARRSRSEDDRFDQQHTVFMPWWRRSNWAGGSDIVCTTPLALQTAAHLTVPLQGGAPFEIHDDIFGALSLASLLMCLSTPVIHYKHFLDDIETPSFLSMSLHDRLAFFEAMILSLMGTVTILDGRCAYRLPFVSAAAVMVLISARLGPVSRWRFFCFEVWIVSLFFYAFGFDPAGTVNPDWIGVFG